MLFRTLIIHLFQIFCKTILYSKVSVKLILDPDNNVTRSTSMHIIHDLASLWKSDPQGHLISFIRNLLPDEVPAAFREMAQGKFWK